MHSFPVALLCASLPPPVTANAIQKVLPPKTTLIPEKRSASARPKVLPPWNLDGSGLGRDSGSNPRPRQVGCCCCSTCGRRRLLADAATMVASSLSSPDCPVVDTNKKVFRRPSIPGWYEELYAKAMEQGMRSYEAEIAGYKSQLFGHLQGENKKVLELGVGTGPNLKFYANSPGVAVFAVDPIQRMEKYAQAAAVAAGLPLTHFTFLQGVGEDLPLMDDSMDAVIGTLVLCSVQDIDATIREVKRVLKPGGVYIFIEHVAAADGSLLKLLQTVVDPLQQWAAYGCHLTRKTGKHISDAGFSDLIINRAFLTTASILGPHVYGIACK